MTALVLTTMDAATLPVRKVFPPKVGAITLGRGARSNKKVDDESSGMFRLEPKRSLSPSGPDGELLQTSPAAAGNEGNRGMSRNHGTVSYDDQGFWHYCDQDSLHGSVIERDGEQISLKAKVQYRLFDKDLITFGRLISRQGEAPCTPLTVLVHLDDTVKTSAAKVSSSLMKRAVSVTSSSDGGEDFSVRAVKGGSTNTPRRGFGIDAAGKPYSKKTPSPEMGLKALPASSSSSFHIKSNKKAAVSKYGTDVSASDDSEDEQEVSIVKAVSKKQRAASSSPPPTARPVRQYVLPKHRPVPYKPKAEAIELLSSSDDNQSEAGKGSKDVESLAVVEKDVAEVEQGAHSPWLEQLLDDPAFDEIADVESSPAAVAVESHRSSSPAANSARVQSVATAGLYTLSESETQQIAKALVLTDDDLEEMAQEMRDALNADPKEMAQVLLDARKDTEAALDARILALAEPADGAGAGSDDSDDDDDEEEHDRDIALPGTPELSSEHFDESEAEEADDQLVSDPVVEWQEPPFLVVQPATSDLGDDEDPHIDTFEDDEDEEGSFAPDIEIEVEDEDAGDVNLDDEEEDLALPFGDDGSVTVAYTTPFAEDGDQDADEAVEESVADADDAEVESVASLEGHSEHDAEVVADEEDEEEDAASAADSEYAVSDSDNNSVVNDSEADSDEVDDEFDEEEEIDEDDFDAVESDGDESAEMAERARHEIERSRRLSVSSDTTPPLVHSSVSPPSSVFSGVEIPITRRVNDAPARGKRPLAPLASDIANAPKDFVSAFDLMKGGGSSSSPIAAASSSSAPASPRGKKRGIDAIVESKEAGVETEAEHVLVEDERPVKKVRTANYKHIGLSAAAGFVAGAVVTVVHLLSYTE